MMWNANYAGPSRYSFTTYSKTPLMLSMLGGIVGDSAVWRAQSEFGKAWMFKHPSPWDYMFFMNRALKQDLSWFWYYWLFTTERVDESIQSVTTSGPTTTVVVRQDGEMPSPVVLKVVFVPFGAPIRSMPNVKMADTVLNAEGGQSIAGQTAIVTWPVDVWFRGSRTFKAELPFSGQIVGVVLDPFCRFPDRDPSDNVWPRSTSTAAQPAGRAGRGGAPYACGG
jgi:hypothetical protein